MNSAQKAAIQANLAQLCDTLDVQEVIFQLRANNILDKNTAQLTNNQPNDKSKALFLIDLLQNRDDAWEALLDVLRQTQRSNLADLLQNSLIPASYSIPSITDATLKQLQHSLRQYIQEDCGNIRGAWDVYLPVTQLASTFQKLKVIQTNRGGTLNKNIDCDDYNYLTDKTVRIFVIEGDPGIGKSTYVNKLALEWANGHQMLNEAFHFVVTVTWQQLNETDWQKSIVSAFGDKTYADCLQDLLKSNKFLIILDGYDENSFANQKSKELLQQITAKNDPKTGNRISARLLITTRGSHVQDFEKIENKIWIRILGFDGQSAARFIRTQLSDKAEEVEEILSSHDSLVEILQNPLYATMIAATRLTSAKLLEKEPQMRIKHIFDRFLDFQKGRYFKTYPAANEQEYNTMVEQLGKYALKFFNHTCQFYLKRELGNNCKRMRNDEERQLEEKWLKMGLVQCNKQQRINGSNQEINFLHQTLAEYHAAQFVAKHAVKKSKINVRHLVNNSPTFFISLVLALRKDLFIAVTEDKYPNYNSGIPFLPLPLTDLTNLLQSYKLSYLQLYQWLINETLIDMLVAVPAKCIHFNECDVSLMKWNLNTFVKQNRQVTELGFHKCKLGVIKFEEFYQFIYRKFLNLNKLFLDDNSDKRIDNECGLIHIDMESDCDTLKFLTARGRNIDYLVKIFASHKTIQNYYAVRMEVLDVQTDNYNQIINGSQRQTENQVNSSGMISHFYNRSSFNLQEQFRRLKVLKVVNCNFTVQDIVAISNIENLSELIIFNSVLLENFDINQTSKQIIDFNIDHISVHDSDQIVEYLVKNVSVKGKSGDFRVSSIGKNITEHLVMLAQRPFYFNEKLEIVQKLHDDDIELIAVSIICILRFSSCVIFQRGNSKADFKAEYTINCHSSDDNPTKLVIRSDKSEFIAKLKESLAQKLRDKNLALEKFGKRSRSIDELFFVVLRYTYTTLGGFFKKILFAKKASGAVSKAEDRFDIRFVTQHFRQSLEFASSSEDVNLREYLLAYRQLGKILTLLHVLFGYIVNDVNEKCEILEKYLANEKSGKNYESVRQMLVYEKELHVKKESELESSEDLPIGARTLLRLHRALEYWLLFEGLQYVCRLLSDIAAANDHNSMGQTAEHGYDETLSKFHPWVVRQVAYLAMYTLPDRQTLLERLLDGEDISEAAHVLTETAEIGYRVFERIQVMYIEKEWLNLP